MQGKIFAITIIILGGYILANAIFGKHKQQDKPKPNQVYHIGCYDIERPLSSSRQAQRYISELSDQFNATSAARINEVKARVGESKFLEEGGNEIARQFQKYIASYQNIKSRNQYQQTFFNTLKQTKDSFLQCREQFNKQPWNCRSLANQYNSTDYSFQVLKDKLSKLMKDRADHLNKTQDLLRDEDITKDIEFIDKYNNDISKLNQLISNNSHHLHGLNETLLNTNNKIFRYEHQLVSTQTLLTDCSKNREQIDYCKNISEYVTGLYDQVNLEQIERSMNQKKTIIDLLKAHLIQSKKLGEDVTTIERQLAKLKQQLQDEEMLYYESNSTGKCSVELQFRCSQENIVQLQKNVTLLTTLINRLNKEKDQITVKIYYSQQQRIDLQTKITRLNEELKNNAVDIEHLQLKQDKKKRQLQLYRQQLNDIVYAIGKVNKEIIEIKLKRLDENKNVDILMRRSQELIECLGKKELYEKLNSKKPKNTEQDEMLKHKASQSLTNLLKKLIGK